jgi:hypothetical protein
MEGCKEVNVEISGVSDRGHWKHGIDGFYVEDSTWRCRKGEETTEKLG